MKTSTSASASILPAFVPMVPRQLAIIRLVAHMCDNTYSLRVSLKEDGTIAYSLFGGHGVTGISHSLNIALPTNGRLFKSTEALVAAIRPILLSGFYHKATAELFNQIF